MGVSAILRTDLIRNATSYAAVSYSVQSSTYLGVPGRSPRKRHPWGTGDANLSTCRKLPLLATHTFCLNDIALPFSPFLNLKEVCVGLNPQGIDQASFLQSGGAQTVKFHDQSCAKVELLGHTHAHASLTGIDDVQVVLGSGQQAGQGGAAFNPCASRRSHLAVCNLIGSNSHHRDSCYNDFKALYNCTCHHPSFGDASHMDQNTICHSVDLEYPCIIHDKTSHENCPKMLLRARLIDHVRDLTSCQARGISRCRKSDLKMKGFYGALCDNVAEALAPSVDHSVYHHPNQLEEAA